MKFGKKVRDAFGTWLLSALLFGGASSTLAQVSPAEIRNPQLKAAEEKYFEQLKDLNRDIRSEKFPFPFLLSRYVGLDPEQQEGADTRGLEFVLFHNRMLLKVTGNYNAAYQAERLTENERAAHTFQDVIVPILQLIGRDIPTDMACDGIGFEISHHVRTKGRNFEYEGKEILVAVFDKADAFAYSRASSDDERQEILNRSEIYLNGKEFGLALSSREPLDVGATGRVAPAPSAGAVSPASAANAGARLATVNPTLLPGATQPGSAAAPTTASSATPASPAPTSPAPSPTPADVERLQGQYQAQLDTLMKDGAAKFHFVDYAPPSFAIFRNQLVLQITLRNTLRFNKDATSIYKRAAQSFDLFLAPQLKDLLDKIPGGAEFDSLDLTVLNALGLPPKASSEAIEFVCSRKALQQFAEAELTNQQLIDQSVVLVNGVRIALNLQLVE